MNRPKPKPAKPLLAAKPKARPGEAPPKVAARPKIKSSVQMQRAGRSEPRKLARTGPRHPRLLAQTPHHTSPTREARSYFEYRHPEERPHSGPVYDTPPGTPAAPTTMPTASAPAYGCDETCQYRDWLNRYAAWYRDFGRYYYGVPPHAVAPGRPAPPPPKMYSENHPRPSWPDQSERDRLDPWHGYNPHSPDNGY